MRLLLHIGTEKTGTTSSQAWFRDNREALKRQGILYPLSLGQTDHRKLSVCARDPHLPDDGFARYGISSPDEHAAFVEKTREEFDRELDALDTRSIDTIVVSSEHLHSRITTRTMVSSVRDFFEGRVGAVDVVVFLRPQIDLAVSFLGTAVRNGTRGGSAWFHQVEPRNSYYNYDDLIGRWEEGFGSDNVKIVQYSANESLISHVCEECRLDTASMSAPSRKNVASSVQFLAMMNAVNDGGERRVAPAIRDRMRMYLGEVGGAPLSIGRALAEAIQARFHESNARLAARRSDLSLERLNGDLGRYEGEGNLATLDQASPFAAELRAMLESYELALGRESVRALLAEADLLIGGGKVRPAEGKVRAAHRILASGSGVPGAQATFDRLRARADDVLARCARPAASQAIAAPPGDARRRARASGAAERDRKRVAVLDVQVPFVRGDAERLADGLVDAIDRLVPGARAERVPLPVGRYPHHAILDALMTGRLADVAESDGRRIDLAVALGFPAWLAPAARMVCWVSHEHRVLYEAGPSPDLLPGFDRDPVLRDRVHRLDTAALQSALGCFSTSDAVARRLVRLNGVASEVVHPPSPLTGRIVQGPYGSHILHLGGVEPIDRVALLLEALTHVPEMCATVVGPARQVDAVRQRAAALGVAARCDVTGPVSDEERLRHLATARAVFAGSAEEDHGFAYADALQAGKPLVTLTDAPEARRIVDMTGAGWVCEPTVEALAGVLGEAWGATSAALHRRAAPGRDLALGPSWETVVARLVVPFL